MPKKRPRNKRKPNKRILILCEGAKTEPNYFKSLKKDKSCRNKLAALRIEIYDSDKNTGRELVQVAKDFKKLAQSERNPYDAIWIVLDKDGYTKHPHTFDQAYVNEIDIAFSSISFEFWFLLHFEYTTRPFQKADDVIEHLTKKNYLPSYSKNTCYYSILENLTSKAIKRAKRIRSFWKVETDEGRKIYDLNPYVDVDVLVEKLINL